MLFARMEREFLEMRLTVSAVVVRDGRPLALEPRDRPGDRLRGSARNQGDVSSADCDGPVAQLIGKVAEHWGREGSSMSKGLSGGHHSLALSRMASRLRTTPAPL